MSARSTLGYRLVTTVALAAAAAGVALPLLPTAPFLLLAAWSASHHSPELEARLLANPRVGPHIRAWREERALSRRAKRNALVALAELPLQIKGFGPVKAANAAKAEKRREEFLAVLRDGGTSLRKAAE